MDGSKAIQPVKNSGVTTVSPLVLSYLKVLGGHPDEVIASIGRIIEDSPRTSAKIGPKRFYFLTEPDDIENVLVRKAKQCPISSAKHQATSYRPGLKIGNVPYRSEAWKKLQRGLRQYVTRDGLKEQFSSNLAMQAAAEYLRSWDKKTDINVKSETEMLTLKYSWAAFLSETIIDEDAAKITEQARSLNRYLTLSMCMFGRAPTSILKSFSGVSSLVETLDTKLSQAIDTRLEIPPEDRPNDFLGLVIDRNNLDTERNEANQEQALSELTEIIMASTVNSSTTLYWSMHNLSANPEYQQRIRNNANDNNDLNEPAHAATMETLRLYPPVHLLVRKSDSDVQLDEDFTIAKGSYILIPSWYVHRDPRWYPDPDNYNPDENFSPAARNNRPKMSFLSFAGGPHSCPGAGTAGQQISGLLELIYTNYNITSTEEHVPGVVAGAVLDPEPDSRLNIEPIHNP